MFDVLNEWLVRTLGKGNCMNIDNIGGRFKDGVLFARLLQKYQVIPDCYINEFKKTHLYAACLNNMKKINLWLQFLNIMIGDNDIQEIAHGKSQAVLQLLYKLYMKLENVKEYQMLDCTNTRENGQLNDNTAVNSRRNNNFQSNNTLCQARRIPRRMFKKKAPNSNVGSFDNILKSFSSLEGIQYTAIDLLKSTKGIDANKDNTLDILQHNMNCVYDLLIQNLNDTFFENKIANGSNEIFKSAIFDTLNIKDEDNSVKTDGFKNMINDQNPEMSVHKQNSLVPLLDKLDNSHRITRNVDRVSDNAMHVSRDDLNVEQLTSDYSEINKSSATQSIDEHENYKMYEDIHSVEKNILNDYTQHAGVWSNEYLNIDQHECNQQKLSMIVTDILNFDHSKSQIKCTEIKKTSVAGVIDAVRNKTVVQLIKDNLESKGILSFTTNDAINACLNAYKKELKISLDKDKLYRVIENNEQNTTTKTQSSNQTLNENLISNQNCTGNTIFNFQYYVMNTKPKYLVVL